MISLPRRHHAFAAALAASALAVTPAVPASAATPGECAAFAARSQADLVKITALDASALHPRLPALLDVRLASAQGVANSSARPHRTVATAQQADAKLLGMRLPSGAGASKAASKAADEAADEAAGERPGDEVGKSVSGGLGQEAGEAASKRPSGKAGKAVSEGPGHEAGEAVSKGDDGPVTVSLAKVDTGGPVTVEGGKSTAEARWDDAYLCGKPGPLTRSATMLAGISLLAGGGRAPAMRAVDRGTGTDRRTSLLRIGPTGSTQSATDVLTLPDGRRGVAAAAGAALADITLFGGTPQEISAKVINQPTLTVVAGGAKPQVDYQPATLRVTAGGRPVGTLTTGHTSVGLDLFGRVTGEEKASLLGVKLSLGEPRRMVGEHGVRAEVAALRLEVTLGRMHVLDVALAHLAVEASSRPATRVEYQPVAAREDGPTLPITGVDAMTAAAVGGVLLLLGGLSLVLVRRRG